MASTPDSSLRLGLVGTGPELVRAIEALTAAPGTEIVVVVDASERSEGAKLARRLRLPVITTAADVFRSRPDLVLEVSGDERRYERLLALKPPGVEILGTRGARLLVELLRRPGEAGAETPAEPAGDAKTEDPKAGMATRLLASGLRAALHASRAPADAAQALLPAIAAAAGMDLAALAVPSASGVAWVPPGPHDALLAGLEPDRLAEALARSDPLWLASPVTGLGVVGLFPLRVEEACVGVLAVARAQDGAASPEELERLRFGADILAAAVRARAGSETAAAGAADAPCAGGPDAAAMDGERAEGRPRILLVTADPRARSAVGQRLGTGGYAVTCSPSALEGIEAVRRQRRAFDLVITALAMPDVPGWDVVLAVKERHARTPVIVLSGFDRARTMRRAKDLDVDAVMWEPVDPPELLRTVQTLVGERVRDAS